MQVSKRHCSSLRKRSHLDEEQDEDGYKSNAFRPRVAGDGSRQTWIAQGFVRGRKKLDIVSGIFSLALARVSPTCMKAVVTITPEPKYLAMKKAHAGTPIPCRLAAKTGNHVPRKLPTRITKMDDMRVPMRPSYSFPGSQVDIVAVMVDRCET